MKTREKDKKSTPGISTASLPDIVFMLLFFFMVTTVMRETTLKVEVVPPKATEVAKLDRRSLVSHIYIGPPIKSLQPILGSEPRIQLNDAIRPAKDIPEFVEMEVIKRPEPERPMLTFSLKVNHDTKMKVVTEVKQQLRSANALKINYSARKEVFKN